MAQPRTTLRGPILAIDIGATFVKYCPVDEDGKLLAAVTRIPTPYPCLPATLVDAVTSVINASAVARAGVGFPGDMHDGLVVEPGNLSRAGGITTPVDVHIDRLWRQFDLGGQLQHGCAATVRVVNDATLAAHGYAEGRGRELVFTLGTGLGISFVVDGRWKKIRDVGGTCYLSLGTYDEVFGEPSRTQDEALWRRRLADALTSFVEEFSADVVHLGGGNARFVQPQDVAQIGCCVTFNDNEGTLRGAARLFRD